MQRRRWIILGVLVISLLVVVLDNTVLNVALKVIADPKAGLGATQGELQWAINSYTLVFAGLLFTSGVLGDRLGRKRLLIIGMIVFGLGSLFSAYAQDPGQLIAARAVMGLGGAVVMPQTLSIISNVFTPAERPRAIGIWAGAVGLGIAIGPTLGGLLLDHFWWGSVFLINVPVVIIGVTAMAVFAPESRDPKPGRLDPLGVLGSILGLVLLTYGIISGGQAGSWADPKVLGTIAAGIVVIGAFIFWESRIDHPSLDVRLFRNPRMSAAVGLIALTFFALSGVVFFLTFYLQSVRGYTPFQAGLLVIPLAFAQLIFSPRSAGLVRRFGPKAVSVGGLLLVALALSTYGWLITATIPIWVVCVVGFVQGTGMAVVMPAATESIMSTLPRERAGAGSAVQNTARQTAIALGVAVVGSIVSTVYRGHIEGSLTALPSGLRHAAGESIESTMAVVAKLGPAGARLIDPAKESFMSAMHVAGYLAGGFALLGLLVAALWLPGRSASERTSDTTDPADIPPERAMAGVAESAPVAEGARDAAYASGRHE
ncbi:MAG TPA: DHA2 family efflux MFS transporter permease subunit [Streptosporangiaceae bacterium]